MGHFPEGWNVKSRLIPPVDRLGEAIGGSFEKLGSLVEKKLKRKEAGGTKVVWDETVLAESLGGWGRQRAQVPREEGMEAQKKKEAMIR